MLTVAACRLHVTLQTSPDLDFFDFIRSVVADLLKNTSSSPSGPSGRRIINKIVGSHDPVNAESPRTLRKLQKEHFKKMSRLWCLLESYVLS